MPHTEPIVLELLSPAKDKWTGMAAIDHGADAIYIGASQFGARQAAGNPLEDIKELCDYAHRYHARIYLALNTLLKDSEIEAARSLAFDAYKAGVDALIVQDMGLLMGPLPPIEIHASTQCDIRTPEKAHFLEAVGFSQVVLARELSLDEIKACKAALNHARIEYFVHGALCVSYSGQCYISEATRHRSANRGECAQLCRLPYDVYDLETNAPIAKRSHVLSLKDNYQLPNLEALIEAGVRSFKIEGRLKDVQYVKNITATYRQALDAIIAKHPEYRRASDGVSTLGFTPDPQKSFNRGTTEYFVHGRHYEAPYELAQLATPKSIGKPVARCKTVAPGAIDVVPLAGESLNNGDGLLYEAHGGDMTGLGINTVEELSPGRVRLHLRHKTDMPDGLLPGTLLYRNLDRAFERQLAGHSAERRIPISMSFFVETPDGVTLLVSDGKVCAQSSISIELNPANDPARNLETIKKNLAKVGDTHYSLESCFVPEDIEIFIPASFVNQLRRDALDNLTALREQTRERSKRRPSDESIRFPELKDDGALDYRTNIANRQAQAFYQQHGATRVERAFEIAPVAQADLMTCRHCIRASLKRCPKMLKFHPELLESLPREAFKPLPLLLVSDKGDEFEAHFHCKRTPCEMTITEKSR